MENKKQTAVDWLIESLEKLEYNLEKGIISLDDYIINTKWVKDQARTMEKDQIMKAARQCHFEGLRQSGKNSEEYITYGKQYYNETYGK